MTVCPSSKELVCLPTASRSVLPHARLGHRRPPSSDPGTSHLKRICSISATQLATGSGISGGGVLASETNAFIVLTADPPRLASANRYCTAGTYHCRRPAANWWASASWSAACLGVSLRCSINSSTTTTRVDGNTRPSDSFKTEAVMVSTNPFFTDTERAPPLVFRFLCRVCPAIPQVLWSAFWLWLRSRVRQEFR